jgi:hypothetical protein
MRRLNRRELAVALAAAAPAAAQRPAPRPDELLEASRQQIRTLRAELQKYKLPMAAEPSFRFQA